ncbi:MAG: M50 family metallopeptidase [Catenulisporales bacterium]|jgi:hypothetical protein|nr:M50 family metallopeptidase [Catenulisporales bacterium]
MGGCVPVDLPNLDSLDDVWHRVTGTQPDPSRNLVLAVGAAALLVVLWRPAWRIARNTVTIAHEGGHAAVALLCGRRLSGVRLHHDTSGVTVSYGKPRGPGMVFTVAAGYITPSLMGLGGAWLLAAKHITMLLWASIALLAVLLVSIRNFYGMLSVALTGGAVFAASWTKNTDVQAGFAYLMVWFLLLAGVKPVIELSRTRARTGARDSDADQLHRLTGLPAAFWLFVFALVALGCALAGGRWLLHV